MSTSLVLSVLESIKADHGLKSNYALAKLLGIREASLAHYVHGRSLPDEKTCLKIAQAANLDPFVFTAQVQAMRSRDDETRTLWEHIAARLSVGAGSIAAVVLSAVVSLFSIAPDASATSAGDVSGYQNHSEELRYIVQHAKGVFLCLLACLFLLSHRSFFTAWEHQK